MKKRVMATLLALTVVMEAVGCGSTSTESTEEVTVMASSENQPIADAVTELTGNQMVVVEGQDWGPAVTKTIIKLNASVSAGIVIYEAVKQRIQ